MPAPGLDLPPRPWIVGHRGVRGPVPENTVESLREAVAQGADMVELDVQLTAGGELVVYHDRTVPGADGEPRPVADLSVAERRRCRPVWRCGGEEVPYSLPTLARLLAAAPVGLPLNLEIKRYDRARHGAELAVSLAAAIESRPGMLLSSFDWALLSRLRELLPGAALAPLGGRDADWDELLGAARRLAAFAVHVHRRLAADLGDRGRLDEPAARRRPILAYTVNRADEARRLLRLGVAGVFTDRPGGLRRELRRLR